MYTTKATLVEEKIEKKLTKQEFIELMDQPSTLEYLSKLNQTND